MTTTRRSFLAASAAASVVAPFVRADNKSGSKYPVLGKDDQQYECIHDWGELPSNIKYGNTHSVCEDAQGHIYIHHTVYQDSQSPDSVVVFDEKGKFVRSWGAMFRGGAHGMHLRKEGNTEYLYFCDEKHGVITKRTLKGEEVWTMGYPQDSPIYQKGIGATGPGGPAGLNYRPTNIAIAPNGDIFVADGHGGETNARVVKFSANGQFIKAWGKKGSGPGEFNIPHTIAFDSRGRVFVGDRGNNRIEIFDQDGNFLEQWKQFGRPSGIFIAKDDTIYVVDSESNTARNPGVKRGIRIGNAKDGQVIAFIPDTDPNPDTTTILGAEGVGVDKAGNVYAAQVGRQTLTKFVKQ